MPVPNTFANATATIPLSQLDANFATTITLGNTAIQLGNTVTTLNNMTLANVTVTSGNVTITNVTVTTANVTTANIATAQIANVTVSGTGTFAAGSNTAPSITTSGDTNTGIYFPAADTIAFTEGGVESARFDSSGNFLINATTNSLSAKVKIATATRTANFFDLTATGGENWVINSTNTTGSTDVLGIYANGTTGWYLRDDGNVGVGTSSPASKLHVTGLMRICDASAYLLFRNAADSTSNGVIQFPDSGAASIQQYRNEALYFATNNVERARIAAGGEIKFRNTTGGTDTANTYTSITLGDDSTYAGGLLNVKNAGNRGSKGNGSGSPLARFEFNDATALFIDTSGEVRIGSTTDQGAYNLQCNGTGVWGAAAYVNGSDERIKEDIAPITSGLDVVTKLNPVTYRYKKDWSNDQNIQTGFIAQELLVSMEGKNYVNGIVLQGGSENYYSVAYQNIIPLLTKAIQEQQAMIDEMKAEIAALKGAA